MAITIDWGTKVINVPRADMILIQSVPTEIRQLNLNDFRLTLKDLEDGDYGMPADTTHNHVAPITVGGVTLERVVEIINNYTVTFEDGQYAVNLVGANSNVGDVVNVNQVSVRSANSAGLVNLDTLLAAAYNGQVCIDVVNGQAGTTTPLGTRSSPVNNFEDAKVIAEANALNVLQIMKSATIANVDFSAGYIFKGDSEVTVLVTIDPSANVERCTFMDLTITGTMDGENTFRSCSIDDINYVNGFIFECALNGTITLGGGAQCSILDCWSNVAGGGAMQYPTINMGGSGNSLALRNYSGGIGIENYNGGGAVSMDMASGRVVMETTVTAGDLTVRGIADIEDNSTGTAVVNDLTVNEALDLGFGQVDDLHKIAGLDAANPMTVTPTSRSAGGINQTISGDGETTSTVTRQ